MSNLVKKNPFKERINLCRKLKCHSTKQRIIAVLKQLFIFIWIFRIYHFLVSSRWKKYKISKFDNFHKILRKHQFSGKNYINIYNMCLNNVFYVARKIGRFYAAKENQALKTLYLKLKQLPKYVS